MSPGNIRLEPLTIKGRYFLFSCEPPTVMVVDTLTALFVKEQTEDFDEPAARARFLSGLARRKMPEGAATNHYNAAKRALVEAGLGEALALSPLGFPATHRE